MDLHTSQYLEAIQAIPGCTPGQKYTELNIIARRAVTEAKSHGDVAAPLFFLKEVPEPLEPLVRLKIAKILRQNEVVAEALRSEDRELVDLALRTKWFFRANNKEVINVLYFKTNLYPFVTLNTRMKIIKRLTVSLRRDGESTLAEKFYDFTCQSYGKRQAEPLFAACSESFIWKIVTEQKIVLSRRIVKNLFDKYPELVIRYLKLSKPDDKGATERNLHRIDIYKYTFFLPRLIKNHLKSLIELIEMHESCLGIKLSNKATERFLKGNVDVVLDAPILYKSMMPLKVIAAKITKSQYKRMFAKIYPPNGNDFRYYQVEEYLEHYPEQERISLLLETYKKVYNANMLDNYDIINEEVLKMLPSDERVRQARIKLQKEPDWHESFHMVDKMWRCYLPIEETISSIKEEISKTSSVDERSKLLQQMFFACSINDDKEALLEALQYFTTRHKNERTNVIFEVLNSLVHYHVLSTFGKDHWSVLYNFIKFLNVKHDLTENATLSLKILTAFVYFNLSHDLPIDESIEILIELNMIAWNAEWCIFEKYPEYDRLCFDKMMSLVPLKYPENDKIWSTRGIDTMKNIAKSMGDFNERNANKSNNSKMEKLSIKNYPWLLEAVEKSLKTVTKKSQWRFDAIIDYLKKWEVDLYEKWIPAEFDALADVETGQALKILKTESSKILKHCDEYWNAIMHIVCGKTIGGRFVKASRWYQDIPMRFLARSLESLSTDQANQSLMILAILMTGSEFSSVIEPLIPKDEKTIDTDNENAKLNYWITRGIPSAINLVNPPVPLSLVMSFCDGDFLNLGLTSLVNVSRRSSVDKVERFSKQLADSRISVKKHGIRLFCLVATITDYRDFLMSLWKLEKHRSIRIIILEKIFSLFSDNPCTKNWMMMKDCLVDLEIEDDDILDIIGNFNQIPDAYLAEYMSHLFATFERLEADGFHAKRMVLRISRFLRGITPAISQLLTEEFLEKLVKKYFCNSTIAPDVAQAGMAYTLNGYLRADPNKLDSRLQIFSNIYTDILKEHWNKPDLGAPPGFPINSMTHKFVHDHVCRAGVDSVNVKIMKTILESFLRVLKPQQDWTTYALLTFGIALHGVEDSTSIAQSIAITLPHFVEIFSPVLVIELADIVKKWIRILCCNENLHDHMLYQVIETLCHVSTSDSCALAAKLLFISSDRQYDTRRNSSLRFLLGCPYPVATSLAYEHINTSGTV